MSNIALAESPSQQFFKPFQEEFGSSKPGAVVERLRGVSAQRRRRKDVAQTLPDAGAEKEPGRREGNSGRLFDLQVKVSELAAIGVNVSVQFALDGSDYGGAAHPGLRISVGKQFHTFVSIRASKSEFDFVELGLFLEHQQFLEANAIEVRQREIADRVRALLTDEEVAAFRKFG
jgi:hypothetical protein